MYEIYDFVCQKVVKESNDLKLLIASAKRRVHHVMVREKYSNYPLFDNKKETK